MFIQEKQAEQEAIMQTAKAMCQAARTAPKTKGLDYIHTAILTGEDKDKLAEEMERLGGILNYGFFIRDAGNVKASEAVVLIGVKNVVRGLNGGCSFCGFESCKACMEAGGKCAYTGIDLGIATGSAVSIAADHRADNRVMFSAGRAAMELELLGKDVCQMLGIPISATGKSPVFDR